MLNFMGWKALSTNLKACYVISNFQKGKLLKRPSHCNVIQSTIRNSKFSIDSIGELVSNMTFDFHQIKRKCGRMKYTGISKQNITAGFHLTTVDEHKCQNK